MGSQSTEQASLTLPRQRVLDFIALGKPELTLLSVLTALGGAFLAIPPGGVLTPLLYTFLGTLLVGCGAGALNMAIEQQYDGLMRRTAGRPIPAGRVTQWEALVFGLGTASLGLLVLGLLTTPLASILALLTLVTYLFLYTPLKRLTPYATVVGAIPGALPPVIGWSAVRGEIGLEAGSLFAILFFWQMPHFLSLAWMYRNDYERAGYKLLTVIDRTGRITGRQIFIYAAALLPASILPTYAGLLDKGYFLGAGLLSLAFLAVAVHMAWKPTAGAARRLFLASLIYIPALIGLMILDRI